MNGAQSLVRTLLQGGVDVCFANPGTSEMHFVAALDGEPGMRCVLGLFEGVVTGAADGYARMADKPAANLLHLGPGLANALANMHNAKRARSPMVNVVGDHATYHTRYDAPLTSDVEAVARPFSDWVLTSRSAADISRDGAAAIAVARTPPGRIATLILPADTAWNAASREIAAVPPVPARSPVQADAIAAAASALRSGEPTVLMLGGPALRADLLAVAGRIAARTGARLMAPTSNGRIERGAGRVPVTRVPYAVDLALALLKDVRQMVLLGAAQPVAFFAYPGKPSLIAPPDCAIHALARPEDDLAHALAWLADELGAGAAAPVVQAPAAPAVQPGRLTVDTIGQAIGAALPEGAIVVDESVSAGRGVFAQLAGCPPHDWLQLTGGAIGEGIPMATGAAIGAPGRRVVNIEADGSALYTLQGLWTQAREGLPVTTVIFNNRAYATLRGELANVGAHNAGRRALDMMDLSRPDIDWVGLARSFGVAGEQVADGEALSRALARSCAADGPYLIDALI